MNSIGKDSTVRPNLAMKTFCPSNPPSPLSHIDSAPDRMARFGPVLREDKTRLIEFGRFAEANRRRRGAGRPETFDFLGFTHDCGRARAGRGGSWSSARPSGRV